MDLETFELAVGRTLDDASRATLVAAQHAGYRRTFLVAGLRNHLFVRWTRQMRADDAELSGLAERWSA